MSPELWARGCAGYGVLSDKFSADSSNEPSIECGFNLLPFPQVEYVAIASVGLTQACFSGYTCQFVHAGVEHCPQRLASPMVTSQIHGSRTHCGERSLEAEVRFGDIAVKQSRIASLMRMLLKCGSSLKH